jgi:DNA-binding MarR family transcriptional regulator
MDRKISLTKPSTRRAPVAGPVKALSPSSKPSSKAAKSDPKPLKAAASRTKSPPNAPAAAPSAGTLNTQFLESLLGYNARRAALVIIGVFLKRMAPYGLRPVDFSVLSVIEHNPGVTSRQLCAALNILPPNFVKLLGALEQRKLVDRKPHPDDKRAAALHLTPQGHALVQNAEVTVRQLEREGAARLTQTEHATLIRLLQKVYLS